MLDITLHTKAACQLNLTITDSMPKSDKYSVLAATYNERENLPVVVYLLNSGVQIKVEKLGLLRSRRYLLKQHYVMSSDLNYEIIHC